MTMRRGWPLMLPALCAVLLSGASGHPIAAGTNGVASGEFIVDPPTLINLGFEWLIDATTTATH